MGIVGRKKPVVRYETDKIPRDRLITKEKLNELLVLTNEQTADSLIYSINKSLLEGDKIIDTTDLPLEVVMILSERLDFAGHINTITTNEDGQVIIDIMN